MRFVDAGAFSRLDVTLLTASGAIAPKERPSRPPQTKRGVWRAPVRCQKWRWLGGRRPSCIPPPYFAKYVSLTRVQSYGVTAVPDLDFTSEMSERLIAPLTVTSVRKFEALTDCDLSGLTRVDAFSTVRITP